MPNQNETNAPAIDWKGFLLLLSPEAQQRMVDIVVDARENRGANWLPEIKAEFPMAAWVVELVCTRTAEQALDDVCDAYDKWPVRLLAGNAIIGLHARLKFEIEKPR